MGIPVKKEDKEQYNYWCKELKESLHLQEVYSKQMMVEEFIEARKRYSIAVAKIEDIERKVYKRF